MKNEKLTYQITVRFTENQINIIDEMAQQKKRKRADLIRLIIEKEIEEYKNAKDIQNRYKKEDSAG